MTRITIIITCLLLGLSLPAAAQSRRFNDQIENRPYTDMRAWHLGFSIGAHADDLRFTHNGYITPSGEQWRIEQPSYQPGFSVTGLVALRLNEHFSLRLSPGMMFGSRDLKFRDVSTGAVTRQNIKSTYIVMPLDVKFAAMRALNSRPYISAGLMPAFDVAKKRTDLLKLTTADMFATFGFGCDFYLPYFKLIPEVKFCLGLKDILVKDRPDLADNPDMLKYTQSLDKATSKMIVVSFYFE